MGVKAESFQLCYRPPFDWPFFLRYFQARSTPGVEAVNERRYSRIIELGRASGVLQVEHQASKHRLVVTVSGDVSRHVDAMSARVTRMFDLNADMPAIHRVLLADDRLAPHIRAAPGIRVPGAWSAFEIIARAIVGQQISVKAASTIMGRIAQRFGRPVSSSAETGLSFLFPSPRAVADGDFSRIGMPSKRSAALQNVARAIADGAIPFSDDGATVAGVKESLLAQGGIGPWTVEYFALRALRDPDAWPGTDLVLRREILLEPTASRTPADLSRLSDAWKPWRAYAAVHLWNKASAEKQRAGNGLM